MNIFKLQKATFRKKNCVTLHGIFEKIGSDRSTNTNQKPIFRLHVKIIKDSFK